MQAWHKEQKAKAIKKSKASQQKERNEKLGRRNPDRLQRQIDELKTVIEAGRDNAHNRRQLADLEKDLAAVRRARKALGIEDEARAGQKRRREGEGESVNAGERVEESDSGESTSSSVVDIPLPPGPLPPLPGEEVPEVKMTYESAPILRDLRKEAAAFVPAAVKRKLEAEKARAKSEELVQAEAGEEEDGEVEDGQGNGRAEPAAEGAALGFGMRINAAPNVDVDEEMRRFNVEMEDDER